MNDFPTQPIETPKPSSDDFFKTLASFAKRRSGLLFSFAFVLSVIAIYCFEVKTTNKLSNLSYVQQYVNEAETKEQLNYAAKLQTGEEFVIDRSFFTRTLRVSAKLNETASSRLLLSRKQYLGVTNGYNGLQLEDNYVVTYGDTSVFTDPLQWEKIVYPDKFQITNDISFELDNNVYFDNRKIWLTADENQLGYIDKSTGISKTFTLLPEHLNKGFEMNSPEDDSYFLFGNSIGIKHPYNDTLYLGQVTTGKETYQKDLHLKIVLPELADNFQISNGNLLFDVTTKDSTKIYSYNPLTRRLFKPVFAFANASDSISWRAYLGNVIIAERKSITIYNSLRGAQRYPLPAAVILKKINGIFGFSSTTAWLSIESESGSELAKVNLRQNNGTPPKDSIQIIGKPQFKVEQNYQVNDDGFVAYEIKQSNDNNQLKFFICKNDQVKFEESSLYSITDSTTAKAISDLRLFFPSNTKRFEFIVFSDNVLKGAFQILPDIINKSMAIKLVGEKGSDPKNLLSWGSLGKMGITETFDYFFGVLMIITGILIYFLGLFYVLDSSNSNPSPMAIKLPNEEKLSVLNNKVSYLYNTTQSLKLRSEIMLWIGLMIGIAGMLAFVFSLKSVIKEVHITKTNADFIIPLLRTFSIFSFMEIFAFYFLKQYRITFNEYKRFCSHYLRALNYFQYIQITNEFANHSIDLKELKEVLLKDISVLHEDGIQDKINEFDRGASDIIKSLASKIPNA